MEQLGKCLTTLRHMYEDLNEAGIACPNEAEFRAYGILAFLNDPKVVF